MREAALVLFLSGIPINLFRSEAADLLVVREAGIDVVLSTCENGNLLQVVHKVCFTGHVLSIRWWIPPCINFAYEQCEIRTAKPLLRQTLRSEMCTGVLTAVLKNVTWFRGGIVYKAHRLVYHSTLGSRFRKKKKKVEGVHLRE